MFSCSSSVACLISDLNGIEILSVIKSPVFIRAAPSIRESFLTDEMIPVTPEYGPEIIAMNELADIYSLSIHFLNCSNVTVGA